MIRKDLDVKLSWFSWENWKEAVERGYLPVLAIVNPKTHKNTPVHFPLLAPRVNPIYEREEQLDMYWDHLHGTINPWRVLNTFDVLSHLSCSSGIMVLTEKEIDPFRELLGMYLDGILDHKITEYEWGRGNSELLADI